MAAQVSRSTRNGNCHDNAAMESFFGILKSEIFYLNRFDSVDELRTGLADCIHYFYESVHLRPNEMVPLHPTKPQ
jgi:transposase InsO family protein